MSRRRLLMALKSGSLLIKPEDVPDVPNLYALFSTSNGDEYCVLASKALASENNNLWSEYTFLGPVIVMVSNNIVNKVVVGPVSILDTYMWNGTNSLIPGMTTTTDNEVAYTDLAGVTNTRAFLKAFTDDLHPYTVFHQSQGIKLANGRQSYVAGVGEFYVLKDLFDDLNVLLEKASLGTIPFSGSFHSSTQWSSSQSWYLSMGINTIAPYVSLGNKSDSRMFLPIAPLLKPSVPDNFIKLSDLPDAPNVYALFRMDNGDEYCVLDSNVLDSYFTDYTFLAPVVVNAAGSTVVKLVIYPTYDSATYAWSSNSTYSDLISGVTQATSVSNAATDYKGQSNTENAAEYYTKVYYTLNYCPLIQKAMYTKFANDRQAYVPAGGEMMLIKALYSRINSLITKSGGTAYPTSTLYWATSTISTTRANAYRLNALTSTALTSYTKTSATRVMLVAPLFKDGKDPEPTPVPDNLSYRYEGAWILNSDGYYESNTITHSQSTTETVYIQAKKATQIKVSYFSSSETNYDWLYIGKMNTAISTASIAGYTARTSGVSNNASSPLTVIIDVPAGDNYIQFMYSKDSSASSGNDKGYFKIEEVK